jgi:hypothetical protein
LLRKVLLRCNRNEQTDFQLVGKITLRQVFKALNSQQCEILRRDILAAARASGAGGFSARLSATDSRLRRTTG